MVLAELSSTLRLLGLDELPVSNRHRNNSPRLLDPAVEVPHTVYDGQYLLLQRGSYRPVHLLGIYSADSGKALVDTYGSNHGCSKDRKSTRLNSSHSQISYAVFCLKKKKT